MKIKVEKLNVEDTTKFAKKQSERYPDVIYIEFYEGSISIDIKSVGRTAITILEIAKEILENLDKVEYTRNDPEEWFRQEVEVIKNAIAKRESKLHDYSRHEVDIYYLLDGYASGYFIAFHP